MFTWKQDHYIRSHDILAVDFSFAPLANGEHRCRELRTKREKVVRTVKDVQRFAKEIADLPDFSDAAESIALQVGDDRAPDYREALRKRYRKRAIKTAKSKWNSYMSDLARNPQDYFGEGSPLYFRSVNLNPERSASGTDGDGQ